MMEKELRIIISGGGTGGHIFPAVSIANAIMELRPDAKILFVGAEGRMEMQRVPDAGYRIIGLPIAGFDRKHLWKNVAVLIKLARSQWKARSIIKNFRPQVAVGVGGYARFRSRTLMPESQTSCWHKKQRLFVLHTMEWKSSFLPIRL